MLLIDCFSYFDPLAGSMSAIFSEEFKFISHTSRGIFEKRSSRDIGFAFSSVQWMIVSQAQQSGALIKLDLLQKNRTYISPVLVH